MFITKENMNTKAEELGYKLEELTNLKKGEFIMVQKYIKIRRLDEYTWMIIKKAKPIPFKIERDNKKRKIWRQFMNCCNYSLKYGEQRVEAIAKGIDESAMIEIVSDHQFISQQIKSTTSPLSEDSGFTKTLDKIADYILFTKFDNEIQEEEHKKIKEDLKKLEASKKTEKIKDLLESKKAQRKNTPYSKTKRLSSLPKHYNIKSIDDAIANDSGMYKPKTTINYSRVDKQMQRGVFDESMEQYWERYSPDKRNNIPFYSHDPIEYKTFAFEIMKQYLKEIQYLEEQPFTPNRGKVISNLKSEMRTSLECLKKVISFTPTAELSETIPEESWNYLSLRSTDVYKVLLNNYSDLCATYETQVDTNMWSLLRSFEDLVQKVKWGKLEYIIIDLMLNQEIDKHTEIQKILQDDYNIAIDKSKLSRIINKRIPKLLLDTYEQQLEDWIWIERRKGKYKTCKQCKTVKLAVDNRYFRTNKSCSLGLEPVCKACRNRKNQ
ncbi:hypothetical protein NQ043_09515 [Staphylococcus hyicus]|uniref:hypothetical protein n=1 Tax=Staphylococcus hyicus TaxID=1284 RepID=UPI00211BAAD7|nr:hypothetical protein [Staphylococcus hyicus]MCQ9301363.1 hypothetical protein [Staphylococcus hyicus]